MDNTIRILLIGHITIIFLYMIYLKVTRSRELLFRGIIITVIPAFGLLFFILLDLRGRFSKRSNPEQRKAKVMKDEASEIYITSSDNTHECDYMALSDIMDINDIKMRRKKLFKEINGDITKISPYLKKFLSDNDSEVSHYAAAIITGTRQKINTVCDDMRKEYVKNTEDVDAITGFADSLEVYINSGVFGKEEILKRRFELSALFEKFFKSENDIDEKYYVENIENELALNKKGSAFKLCQQFGEKYPNREKPYFMYLKLFYTIKDKKYFFKVLSYIKESNIVYSKKFDAIVRFWYNAG